MTRAEKAAQFLARHPEQVREFEEDLKQYGKAAGWDALVEAYELAGWYPIAGMDLEYPSRLVAWVDEAANYGGNDR